MPLRRQTIRFHHHLYISPYYHKISIFSYIMGAVMMLREGQRLRWPRLRERSPKEAREKESGVSFNRRNPLCFKGSSNEMKPWGS